MKTLTFLYCVVHDILIISQNVPDTFFFDLFVEILHQISSTIYSYLGDRLFSKIKMVINYNTQNSNIFLIYRIIQLLIISIGCLRNLCSFSTHNIECFYQYSLSLNCIHIFVNLLFIWVSFLYIHFTCDFSNGLEVLILKKVS